MLRYVMDVFDVCEDLIGLYKVPSTDAVTLVATAKEALKDVDLPISKLHGQCYVVSRGQPFFVPANLAPCALKKGLEQFMNQKKFDHLFNTYR